MKKIPSCITAVFDETDEFELSLAMHVVSKGNRSRYIKRLIYNDMMNVKNQVTTTIHEEPNEDREAMTGFF